MLTPPPTMRKTVFLLVLFALSISPAIAACHVVTPNGSGSKTGADWNNAYAGLPSTLVRGDVYYLADGNYGSRLSLNQADAGTETIELRKAQSWSHCTDTGWNTSTMGSGQAVWSWSNAGSPIVTIGSDYWIINGNSNEPAGTIGCGGVTSLQGSDESQPPPTPIQCGIKIDNSTCTSTSTDYCEGGNGVVSGGGTSIVWKSVEWKGSGINANESSFWGSKESANLQQVTHSYLHDLATTCWTYGFNNATFTYNYVFGTNDSSINHGECLQDSGSDSNAVIMRNYFRDTITNGDLVFVAPTTGTHSNFVFADNVITCDLSGGCRHNDGIIACINSQETCTNLVVYNNTIINCTLNCGLVSTNAGSYVWKNNLYYNSAVSWSLGGSAFTEDYNSFLNSGSSGTGTHDVKVTSGALNPFLNWNSTANAIVGSADLTSDNANWNGRVSLGSPYDTDAAGNSYVAGGARGAYEVRPTAVKLSGSYSVQ
jgi:hypothetical protein